MPKKFPALQTERLVLKKIDSTDLSNIYRGLSDPKVTKYYAVHFNSLQETKKQMDWYAALEKEDSGIWWAIWSAFNKRFCGACGLSNLNKKEAKAEIGFWLLPEYQGQDIMHEALSKILEYAFNMLQLHRIEAYVETENEISKKLLSKLHFNREGTLRECEIKNGRTIILDIYTRIR